MCRLCDENGIFSAWLPSLFLHIVVNGIRVRNLFSKGFSIKNKIVLAIAKKKPPQEKGTQSFGCLSDKRRNRGAPLFARTTVIGNASKSAPFSQDALVFGYRPDFHTSDILDSYAYTTE